MAHKPRNDVDPTPETCLAHQPARDDELLFHPEVMTGFN